LLIPAQERGSCAFVNVSVALLMAGFQISINGRSCVSTSGRAEDRLGRPQLLSKAEDRGSVIGPGGTVA